MKIYLAFVAGIILSACTAGGPAFDSASAVAPSSDMAKLIIYRPSAGLAGALTVVYVDVNKKSVCGLSPDGVLVDEVPAGDVIVATHQWGDLLKAIDPDSGHFHVDGGQTYYFVIEPYFGTTMMPEGYGIQAVDHVTAEDQLSKMSMEKCG